MIVDSNATMGRFSDNACRSSGDIEIGVENGLVECPFSEWKHCSVRLECSILATIDAEKVLQLEAQVYTRRQRACNGVLEVRLLCSQNRESCCR